MFSRSLFQSTRLFSMPLRSMSIKVGDKIPSAHVSVVKFGDSGFTSEIVDTAKYLENKKVVIVAYPGAFTPTCMNTHIPEYINNATKVKQQGADEIIAMSVNDPFVVTAFAEKLGGKQHVNFFADGNGEFTKALGIGMDLSVAQLSTRSKRMSMVVHSNKVIEINDENGPKLTEVSSCSTILKQVKK